MDSTELERIEKLAEAATKGPWGFARIAHADNTPMKPDEALEYLKCYPHDRDDFSFIYCEKPDGPADVAFTGCGPTSPENAAFIAAAREAVPALLQAVRERDAIIESNPSAHANSVLRAELSALRTRLERVEKVARRVVSDAYNSCGLVIADYCAPKDPLSSATVALAEIDALRASLDGKDGAE